MHSSYASNIDYTLSSPPDQRLCLALIYWVIGFILAVAGLGVHMEFTSYFPNRSGSEVVWLEQSYPRPKHFFPVAYAVQSVLLSFSSSNAIVLSNYLWRIIGREPGAWDLNGVAIATYTLAVVCVVVHNKYPLWAINVIGAPKLTLLVFPCRWHLCWHS